MRINDKGTFREKEFSMLTSLGNKEVVIKRYIEQNRNFDQKK